MKRLKRFKDLCRDQKGSRDRNHRPQDNGELSRHFQVMSQR
jgi:hypothetical protein